MPQFPMEQTKLNHKHKMKKKKITLQIANKGLKHLWLKKTENSYLLHFLCMLLS